MRRRAAVFLDRDGTLNREVNYLHRAEDLVWIPGAPLAVARLNRAGLLALVVTNQAGVARGHYDEEAVHLLHAHMQAELQRAGAHVDTFYFSPYHVEATVAKYRRYSACRKPGTGMFEQAICEWDVDPKRSFVIGDRNHDIEAGRRLGMTTILVTTGYGCEEQLTTNADHVALDVGAAVDHILQCHQMRGRQDMRTHP